MKHRIQVFREELSAELKENILSFWSSKMVDTVHGGFFGRRDGYDRLDARADKGVILNTRILWTFSHAARNFSGDYQHYAERAYEYLRNHFADRDEGGLYWMVDYKGNPVNTKKQIYAQAFAIYALSEYYMLTKDEKSLRLAIALFELIEQYSFDKLYNGYLEAFDKSWNLLEDLRLSDKDANEKKTMNTHLHVLEAYTNLYRCWPDKRLGTQLRNLIGIFTDRIIRSYHFGLFFDEKWNLKSEEISYGHDIEGSWLLYEAAEVLGDALLMIELKEISLRMVDATIKDGLDSDGGLRNEVNDPSKDWWPQCEALVGLTNSYQLTGLEKYLIQTLEVWEFVKSRLIDRANGEWHWGINSRGEVNLNEDKAGPWKCPYHNSRAILELLKRLPT